ncbi:Major facilitator superfamily domain, general substrate transporter [Cordyceps fumosorosea ARSEF 2679]|uniref:Autophagy-related protein n=1 Tax=Cordyceps fumosorosea (strain ARSEF 2679) TaxID=1081104 RepID=A0A162N067_CORFA|nr:Major facilitator superfamily domain, general substrate transporter [Cordyceps fumosorosea ARSEF 2679]OAA73409.1 Major facilitator superfamily domain, general substrate transporter [Cordyceps fumosorosea ARSEF 2679]
MAVMTMPDTQVLTPQASASDRRQDSSHGSGARLHERQIAAPILQEKHVATTSRLEIWSWYAYYVGANGIGPFNFAPTAFQNLLAQAAALYGPDANSLPFAGRVRDVNSIVLFCNGVAFAIQTGLFLVIGAYADFGTGRRWLLLGTSVLAYAVGFAWVGVHDVSRWRVAAALYMAGSVTYQLATAYWIAAFPALARNTRQLKEARAEHGRGAIGAEELARRDELERSRLSNVAFWAQSAVEIALLAVIVGVMRGVQGGAGDDNNWALSVLIAFATGFWLILSVPWFFIEKTRPGLAVPPGKTMLTVGAWQLREAFTQMWRLKQSLIFLAGYFLLGDALNTTVTLVGTLQNEIVNYDSLQLTYLLIVNIAAQTVGIGSFWLIQKRYNLRPKTMFAAIMVGVILLDAWGMVGNWTTRFGGFQTVAEIWAYQVFYGLFVCPWYSYAQIMISSVTPRGYEYLFFSLFSVVGKASSLTGPLISSAIIDASPDRGPRGKRAPFYFLFALSLVSALGLFFFLDLDKSAREQNEFLAEKAARVYGVLDGQDEQVDGVNKGLRRAIA